MEDTTIGGIMEVLPLISNGIITDIENFCRNTEIDIKNCLDRNLKSRESYQHFAVALDPEKHLIEKYEEDLLKNSAYLAKLQTHVKELTDCESSLKNELAAKETKEQALQMKISVLEKKKKMLSNKRDQILACKLLTNTNFYLHGSDVVGYTFCTKTKNVKPFDFKKSSRTSRKEIVDSLYENILTVSSKSTDKM